VTYLERTVVSLSSHTPTETERSYLEEGITFSATTPGPDRLELTVDLHSFYRRLSLKDHFVGQKIHHSIALHFCVPLAHSSTWQPPEGTYSPEVFINVFHLKMQDALRLAEQHRTVSNLSEAEVRTLQYLSQRADILTRLVDKDCAIVILDKVDYDQEIMRQLSDQQGYTLLNCDPTRNTTDVVDMTQLTYGHINKNTSSDLVES